MDMCLTIMEYHIDDCAICLCAFVAPMITNCGHTFCATCLRSQLASGSVNAHNCANCRGVITAVTQNFAIRTEVNQTAEADRTWLLQNHAHNVRPRVADPPVMPLRLWGLTSEAICLAAIQNDGIGDFTVRS